MTVLESDLRKDDAYERRRAHWLASRRAAGGARRRCCATAAARRRRQRQREQGKMTARERVAALCDPGAPFLELGLWAAHGMYAEWGGAPAAGVVVGIGADPRPRRGGGRERRHGQGRRLVSARHARRCCARRRSRSRTGCRSSTWSTRPASSCRCRTRSSPTASTSAASSTTTPGSPRPGVFQMAAIMGSCVAGGAYLPIMSDESHIVEGTGSIFLAGSHLVQAAIGERIDNEELGGALVQCDISGVVDHRHPDDASCLRQDPRPVRAARARRARAVRAPRAAARRSTTREELLGVLPVERTRPYDTHELLARLLDGCELDEYKATYGQTLVCGTGWIERLGGGHRRQPALDRRAAAPGSSRGTRSSRSAASSTRDSADKGARFVELCNQKRIPLLFLQDVTGFMVGTPRRARRHHQGRRQDGERGRQLGGAEDHRLRRQLLRRRQLRHVRQGLRPALPLRLAVGVDRGDGRRAGVARPCSRSSSRTAATRCRRRRRRRCLADIQKRYAAAMDPRYAAARLWVDAIIDPRETREVLARALAAVRRRIRRSPEFRTGVLQT